MSVDSIKTTSAGACPGCGEKLDGRHPVHLWDGRDYCRECVQQASPALLNAAEAFHRPEETLTYSAWKVFHRISLTLAALFNAVFGSIAFFVGWQRGGVLEGAASLAVCAVFLLAMAWLFAALHAWFFSIERPSVSVGQDTLRVVHGDEGSATYRLSDCEWYIGALRDTDSIRDKAMWPDHLPRRPAVILVPPRSETGRRLCVAVGYTPETLEIWRAFLTLA